MLVPVARAKKGTKVSKHRDIQTCPKQKRNLGSACPSFNPGGVSNSPTSTVHAVASHAHNALMGQLLRIGFLSPHVSVSPGVSRARRCLGPCIIIYKNSAWGNIRECMSKFGCYLGLDLRPPIHAAKNTVIGIAPGPAVYRPKNGLARFPTQRRVNRETKNPGTD